MTWSTTRVALVTVVILLLLGGVVLVVVSHLQHLSNPGRRTPGRGAVPQNPVDSGGQTPIGRLEYRGAVTRDDLRAVCNVVISADGRHLYAAAFEANAILAFRRDAGSGALEHVQSIQDIGHLDGVTWLQLSPDDRSVYATATLSGSLACFERSPTDGQLRFIETLTDDPTRGDLKGAAGICCSPDGRFVYVAAEGEQTITVYERHTGE